MDASIIGWLFVFAVVLVLPLRNRSVYFFLIALVSVAIPRTIWVVFGDVERPGVGIASGTLTFSTYDLVLLLLSLWAMTRLPLRLWLPWVVPAGVALVGGIVWGWPHTGAVMDGALAYGICLAAWTVGTAIGVDSESPSRQRTLAFGILLFIGTELVIAALQLASGSAAESRATGTFAHPAFLGKYILLLLVVLLPLTQSKDSRTSRMANFALLCGVVVTAMTLSRANAIAVMGAVMLWLLSTMLSAGRRKGVLVGGIAAVLVATPFANLLLERFETDTEGGDRPALFAAGLNVIRNKLWTGTGPNNFVEYAMNQYQIVAETGYPIHNSFLLAVAEIGVIAALFFFLPLMRTAWVALRWPDRSPNGRRGPLASATLIVAAMVVVAGWTGWGFLQLPTSALMFLAFGYVHGRLALSPRDGQETMSPELVQPLNGRMTMMDRGSRR